MEIVHRELIVWKVEYVFPPWGRKGWGQEIQASIHYMSLKTNHLFMDNHSPEKTSQTTWNHPQSSLTC